MPRSRPPYPAELRARILELVRSGRRPEDLAREFEPTAQAIRNWVAQADRASGPAEGHRYPRPPGFRGSRAADSRGSLCAVRSIPGALAVRAAVGDRALAAAHSRGLSRQSRGGQKPPQRSRAGQALRRRARRGLCAAFRPRASPERDSTGPARWGSGTVHRALSAPRGEVAKGPQRGGAPSHFLLQRCSVACLRPRTQLLSSRSSSSTKIRAARGRPPRASRPCISSLKLTTIRTAEGSAHPP